MKAALLIVLALVAAACGRAAPTESQGPPAAVSNGRLAVVEQGKEPCCYAEGYVRFLRIQSAAGTVFDGRWDEGAPFGRTLPAGDYRVTRYLRPCDGNCSYLDPPSERCSVRVTISASGETRVQVLPQNLGTCRLTLAG